MAQLSLTHSGNITLHFPTEGPNLPFILGPLHPHGQRIMVFVFPFMNATRDSDFSDQRATIRKFSETFFPKTLEINLTCEPSLNLTSGATSRKSRVKGKIRKYGVSGQPQVATALPRRCRGKG